MLYAGGFGCSKSWAAVVKALQHCQRPRNVGLIGRKSLTDLRNSAIRDFFQLCPPSWVRTYNKTLQHVTFRNGSELFFRPLDDPRTIRGFTPLGWAWVEELTQVSEAAYGELSARMRLHEDWQLFGTTNPDSPEHWAFPRWVDPAQRRADHGYHQGDTRENVFLPESFLESLQRSLSGPDYERYIRGEWTLPGNRIFSNYDDGRNLHGPIELQRHWRFERSIDFGYEHWAVCLWLAWPRPDHCIVYREHFARHALLRDLGADIHAASLPDYQRGIRYERTWADHDAQDRRELAALAAHEHQIRTHPAAKDRVAGLRCVNGAFLPGSDGYPSLWITKDCPRLRGQVLSLRRPDGATKEDDVIEYDDNGLSCDDGTDALRYGVYSRLRESSFDRQPDYQPGMDEFQRKNLLRRMAQ